MTTKKRIVEENNVPWMVREGVLNTRTLTFTESDGVTTIDLTGYSYYCQIREREGGRLIVQVTVDETNLADGIVVLTIPKTTEFGDRSAVYDILQEEDADTTNLIFILGGDIEILATVTEVA